MLFLNREERSILIHSVFMELKIYEINEVMTTNQLTTFMFYTISKTVCDKYFADCHKLVTIGRLANLIIVKAQTPSYRL